MTDAMRRRFIQAAGGVAAAASPLGGSFVLAQPAPVRVGLMLPYTGTYAALGNAITNAFKLHVAEEGGKLGGRTVDLAVHLDPAPMRTIAGELGYEVWCHPSDGPAVWDAIWEAGQEHGLTPLGSTGEFAYLSFEQKRRIVEVTVETAAGRLAVVAGGCDGPPVLAGDRDLRPGVNEVLFNGGGAVRNLRASDYLLDLRFDRHPAQEIKAVVWYTNGNSDPLAITGSSIDGSGHYLVELRHDQGYGELSFLALDLNVRATEPAPLRVESRLCMRADRAGGTVASLPVPH